MCWQMLDKWLTHDWRHFDMWSTYVFHSSDNASQECWHVFQPLAISVTVVCYRVFTVFCIGRYSEIGSAGPVHIGKHGNVFSVMRRVRNQSCHNSRAELWCHLFQFVGNPFFCGQPILHYFSSLFVRSITEGKQFKRRSHHCTIQQIFEWLCSDASLICRVILKRDPVKAQTHISLCPCKESLI